MIKWIKRLFYAVKHYRQFEAATKEKHRQMEESFNAKLKKIETQQWLATGRVDHAVRVIRERTDMHASLGASASRYGENQIILVGRYSNCDYVEIFNCGGSEFSDIIHHCKALSEHANLRRVDAAPGMKVCFDNQINPSA